MTRRSILLGLGNPIMSDDGIGLVVSEEIHRRLPEFALDRLSASGLDVVDRILGHARAILIDSMVTGRYAPGTVVRVDSGSSIETLRIGHSHGINFMEAIEVARSCGAEVPDEIILYGIEVSDPFTIGEDICERVMAKVDSIVEQIVKDLSEPR